MLCRGQTRSRSRGTYTLTMEGAGEDFAVSGDLDITEPGDDHRRRYGSHVIDANELDRAFHVFASLNLSDLTIKNGFASPGGAVLVNLYASITAGRFEDNRTTSLMSQMKPAARSLSAWKVSADITQSQFARNFAYFGGGAVANTFASSFSITDSTFSSNSSHHGGGALVSQRRLSYHYEQHVRGQQRRHRRGDPQQFQFRRGDKQHLCGELCSQSRRDRCPPGTITVNNSTFSGNTASGLGDTLGDQPAQGGELQVGNSILSGPGFDNCDGSVADLGNNLSWPIENNCPGTQDDPRLDTLADNGGPNKTMALLTGSPAIDAGNNETCAATDQRGVTRPQGEACDIGAFESALINVFSVTNTNDSGAGSLRQAILSANATPNSLNGPDEIHFSIRSEGVNTIAPASALPAITEPVVIDGYTQPGASPNTLAAGNNANILIELSGDGCDGVCGQALSISSGGSTVRGWRFTGASIMGSK